MLGVKAAAALLMILAPALILGACGSDRDVTPTDIEWASADYYPVYSAYLEHWLENHWEVEAFVVDSSIGGEPVLQDPRFLEHFHRAIAQGEFAGMDPSLAETFVEVGQRTETLREEFTASVPVTVAHLGDPWSFFQPVESEFNYEALPVFYETFPGARGITQFSHVAFDEAHTSALVCSGFACGYLCGNGYCAYLEQDSEGAWTVVSTGHHGVS